MDHNSCKTVFNEDDLADDEISILLTLLIETVDKELLDGNKPDITRFHEHTTVHELPVTNQSEEAKEEINLETYTLLWCDNEVNSTDDNRQTQVELRQSVNFLKTFETADLCKLYIERKSSEQIILIVSGCIGRKLVPDIHHLSQLIAVYVFCLDIREHELWTQKYGKIRNVTSGRVQLLDSFINDQTRRNINARRQDVSITVFSAASMRSRSTKTVISSREYSHQNLDSDFMWSQLIVEVLLKMQETTREHYFNLFIAHCKNQYSGNTNDLRTIDELEEYYHAPAALFWYTRDSFLYRILNRALRCRDDHILVMLSFFIHDIYNGLKVEQQKFGKDSMIIRLYRGQLISVIELEKMKASVGKFISMNSFFSTTKNRQMASNIYAGARNDSLDIPEEAILFEIDADTHLSNAKPFADITERSAFDKGEEEVLFMLGSVFKIVDVSRNEEEKLWIIKLELGSEEEHDLKPVFEYMKNDIPEETAFMSLGDIYYHMGKYFEAERYFQKMLSSLPETDENLAGCYSNLGMIAYYGYGDFDKARLCYSKALELELQKPLLHKLTLGNIFNNLGGLLTQEGQFAQALSQYSNVLKLDLGKEGRHGLLLAAVHLNIGLVYKELGKYDLALESMNECLAIEMQELPENHPQLANAYNYIALVQQSARDYETSMINFQKALSIQLVTMPDHSRTAITYNNIGMGYVLGFENYTEALLNYEKALKIYENASLTSDHPALISLLTNIGFLHRRREDYDLAMEYYKRALQIQLNCAPNHSSTAVIYNNLALIYEHGFQNDSEALVNYKKAIEIFRISLPTDHPDLGKALSSIGDFYSRTDEYELAVAAYQEALEILSCLSPDRLETVATYVGLGLAYTNGFKNHIDALINLEKGLNIYENLSSSEEIDGLRLCIQEIKQHLENDEPLSYALVPNHRYSMRQVLGDGELLTNNAQGSEHIQMSDFLKKNSAVALYFATRTSPFDRQFTSKLAEIYKQMLSSKEDTPLSFDIVYVWLFDLSKESFDEHYKEMPWKAIPYRESYSTILIKRLYDYFNIQRTPTLIVLKTETGEILTRDGHRAIAQMRLDAIKFWCRGEKVLCPRLSNKEFIWYDTSCDGGCGMLPLIGLRYHCRICGNYDLCAACEEKQGHEHELDLLTPPFENEGE